MYTNLYVYKAPRQFMSGKLYWRYKKLGKWTWKPLVPQSDFEKQVIQRMYTTANANWQVGEEE